MSAPATNVSTINKPVPMLVTVAGRILLHRRIKTQAGPKVLTLVQIPAVDVYSTPQTVEIESASKIGDKDEDISVHCRLGGYMRRFKYTDQETGEQTQATTADNRLTLIE